MKPLAQSPAGDAVDGRGRGGAGVGRGDQGHHEKETCFPYWCELPHAWGWGARPRGTPPSLSGSRLAAGSACFPPHFFLPPGPPLSSRLSIWPWVPGPQLPAGRPPGPLAVRLSVSGWFCCSTA